MRILALPLCLALLAGCATGERASGWANLSGTSWRATEIQGSSVVGAPVTLSFAEGGQVSGDAGCNMFSGSYTQAGTTIGFGPLVSTRRACADSARNAQESRYLSTLQSAGQAIVTGDRMELRGTGGEVSFVKTS